MAPALTSCWRFSSGKQGQIDFYELGGGTLAHTRMRHVQESSGSISLHAHVPGLCQTREWAEGARFRYLRLIFFMRSEVCNASDGITLNLNIGRQHLTDERRETSQLNDKNLVLRCEVSVIVLACLHRIKLTVNREIPKRCAGCPLHLNIGALEQE